MIKSEEKCKGEGCDSHYIQNIKYHLCSKCVFKKNHGGKDQGEVYRERSKEKIIVVKGLNEAQLNSDFLSQRDPGKIMVTQSDIEFHNMKAQDNIEEHDDEAEKRFFEKLKKGEVAIYRPKKKQKSIKRLSPKQAEIEHKYKLVCIDMDYIEEKVCSGCLRYQGGDIKLSHSHIISRKMCKEIGRPELIYYRTNLTYHCMDFGENEGCHRKWENPKRRKELRDYNHNLNIIEWIAPEALNYFK